MNAIKYLLPVAVLLTAALFQVGFLEHIAIAGAVPNAIFIVFFILIFVERQEEYAGGFLAVIMAGFLLDIAFSFHFGVAVTALLLVYFAKKLAFYFIREIPDAYEIFYFLPLFVFSLALYAAALYGFSLLLDFNISFGWRWVAGVCYNAILAAAAYYVFQAIYAEKQDNQMKLF